MNLGRDDARMSAGAFKNPPRAVWCADRTPIAAVFALIGLAGIPAGAVRAQPRAWIADQGNNQVGGANPNNRILEIDPANKKIPPDPDGTDVIVLNTLTSPALSFLDELDLDDDENMWCVVKDDSDQDPDGIVRIDKDTGVVQVARLTVNLPGEAFGTYLEGLAWDGEGLWITGVRQGLTGNVLTRVSPVDAAQIAPFLTGTLAGRYGVNIPGGIAQGLLYDPSGTGYLWHSDVGVDKLYKLDISRLTDGNPGNDDNLSVAEFQMPFDNPKGLAWMEDRIWIAAPFGGIWEFDPQSGQTQKLFNTPAWNLDGIAVLAEPPGPRIDLAPTQINRTIWIGDAAPIDMFTVTNGSAEGTLNYTIEDDAAWMHVDPAAGQSLDEPDTISINYDGEEDLPAGVYEATITVSSLDAYNSPQTVTATLTIETVAPDLDGDADVDLSDYGLLQACYGSLGPSPSNPVCVRADFNGDGFVDANDFGVLQACLSGSNVPADPGCDDGG